MLLTNRLPSALAEWRAGRKGLAEKAPAPVFRWRDGQSGEETGRNSSAKPPRDRKAPLCLVPSLPARAARVSVCQGGRPTRPRVQAVRGGETWRRGSERPKPRGSSGASGKKGQDGVERRSLDGSFRPCCRSGMQQRRGAPALLPCLILTGGSCSVSSRCRRRSPGRTSTLLLPGKLGHQEPPPPRVHVRTWAAGPPPRTPVRGVGPGGPLPEGNTVSCSFGKERGHGDGLRPRLAPAERGFRGALPAGC